jgi:outer membrane protein assembly factor BamD
MSKIVYIFILFVCVSSGCKTEFETIRTSNNPERILKSAHTYFSKKEYDKAITLYELVIQNFRGRAEAEDLFFRYAYSYYHLNDFLLASSYFENFANTFSNSPNRVEAEYMAAYSNYRLSPNSKLDQSYTEKAIAGFEEFINKYPGTERAEEANRLIDAMREKQEQKAFDQGYLYYKIGQYQAALSSFEIMLKDFPDSKKLEEVRYLMLKSSYIQAYNSIFEKKKERYEQTIKLYEKFIKKHPRSKKIREVKNIQKSTIEELKKIDK